MQTRALSITAHCLAARITPGCPLAHLNGDRRAVELGEGKAIEGLVINGPLIAQDADGDGLTEQESLLGVRAPVHCGHVAAQGDIVGELVEFALSLLKQHENCRNLTHAFGSNRYKALGTGFSMTNLNALRRSSGPSYGRWSHRSRMERCYIPSRFPGP